MVEQLLKKLTKVQIMISLSTSIAMIVDSIIMGKFLGSAAMAAYGAIAPFLMIIMIISGILSTGCQVACAEKVGRADIKSARGIVGLSLILTAIFSVLFISVSFLFTNFIMKIVGISADAELSANAGMYLKGFIIGAPAFIGMFVVLPYMQIDGNRKLSFLSVIGMTVGDIIFDVLSVFVFKGGLFGIGVASALSYYVAFGILMCHFFFKKGTLRISFKGIPWNEIPRVFSTGSSSAIQKILRTLMGITANRILLMYGGVSALAAYAVAFNVLNFMNSFGQGISASTLLLSSVFMGDEDRSGLVDLQRAMNKLSVIYNGVATFVLFAFAYPIAMVFTKSGDADISLVVMALRILAFDCIFYSICLSYRNYYQGTKNIAVAQLMTVLEGYGFVGLLSIVLGRFFALTGVCLAFVLGEILTLFVVYCICGIRKKTIPRSYEYFLLVSKDFGVPPEDVLELNLSSVDDVMKASVTAEKFAVSHGMKKENNKQATVLSLVIEEFGKNVIQYGFSADGKNKLDIRVVYKNEKLLVRLRDNCKKFNPIDYMNQFANFVERDELGINLVYKLVDDMKYVNTFGLNIVHVVV